LLVLGEKYKFTTFEKKRLLKKNQEISTLSLPAKHADTTIQKIEFLLKKNKTNLIVLNSHTKIDKTIVEFLTNIRCKKRFSHIKIISIENFLEEYLQKCYIPKNNTDLHFLDEIKEFNIWQRTVKRAIDIFGVFWLFFFSWPVMIKCVIKIKKQSVGNIFFKQKRVGLRNKNFVCIKFRSMHQKNNFFSCYTQKNDPRLFPFGKHMRNHRYDELPQMWNILKGDMHLIGPRAEWHKLVDGYQQKIPYYNLRHLIAPGITGWAQVMYPYGRSALDAHQKLMYDLYYIKHWSIWLELKTVFKTAKTVINKQGI
jgi:lipopolysaccharide/colanic/teichoic acid biosynthesis glycosyltransferase